MSIGRSNGTGFTESIHGSYYEKLNLAPHRNSTFMITISYKVKHITTNSLHVIKLFTTASVYSSWKK